MSALGFRRMITKLGKAAKMPFSVHPHMLRHACGFKLANDGHDTVRLRRRRPGGTCPPQPQCAAINAQRLRRDLLGRDHIFEGVGVQRVQSQHNVDNLERAAWFRLRLLRLAMRRHLLRGRNTLAPPGYR
jgi:hypothetical protein